jgi:hypothetical protein
MLKSTTSPKNTGLQTLTSTTVPGKSVTPDISTQKVKKDFPLEVGNSWVYEYQGYSKDNRASWMVADTVIRREEQQGWVAALVQRDVTLVKGTPGPDFIEPPEAASFWYVLHGNQVFRQDGELNWKKVEQSWLELEFPLPNPHCWYPDPDLRSGTPQPGQVGCRKADTPVTSLKLEAGNFERCYTLLTSYRNGTEKLVFCAGVGFVQASFDHTGTPYGYQYNLSGYLLQGR